MTIYYELTYDDGTTVLAELKGNEFYEYNTNWRLTTDNVVWCEDIN